MTGWLIYDYEQYKKNEWFANELLANCSRFCEMKLILVEKLEFGVFENRNGFKYDHSPLNAPDFAISRTIFPLLSFFLEQCGSRVFNSYDVSRYCNDKRYTYTIAAKTGIPIMNSVFRDKRFNYGIMNENSLFFPCVLKSSFGHGGTEVFLTKSYQDYKISLSRIASNDYLFQKPCKTMGTDLRVYVLNSSIITAVLRTSNGFKSNYSLGGQAERYCLSSDEEKTVYSIIKALPFNADFIGIDFLIDRGRLIFNEIEDVVGCKMLYATTQIDIAKCFSNHIKSTMKGLHC
jgi:RimK family alpha-L-glutamate ligase